MGIETNQAYADQFAAALGWWREAGVDADFLDEPRSWLPEVPEIVEDGPPTRAGARQKAPEAAPPPPPEPEPTRFPEDLDAFHAWWLSAPELHAGRISQRIAPRGQVTPELMVVACAPEGSDREQLLAGPEGKLLEGFLAAAGLTDETVYYGSALPCHSPGADWSPAANRVAAEALRHHIALVRPKRLLVLGTVILPLLGHDSPHVSAVSLSFNHEGTTVPMLVVRRIPAAASQARWKAALWQAWLDWTAPAT